MSCVGCAVGKYKDAVGFQSCTNCPLNSRTRTIASKDKTMCLCSPGYTGVAIPGPCTPCNIATFKAGLGSSACSSCLKGKYGSTKGLSECAECVQNSDSPIGSERSTNCTCNAGYEGGYGEPCLACPRGSYRPLSASACLRCVDGYTTFDLACQSEEECLSCSRGKFSIAGSNLADKELLCQECPSNSISPPAASACTCLDGWKGDRCLIKVKGPPGPGAREFVVSFSMNLPTVVERRSNGTSAPALTAVDIMREKLAEFFSVQPDLVNMATDSRRGVYVVWR